MASFLQAALCALAIGAAYGAAVAVVKDEVSLIQANVQVHRHSSDGIYGNDDCQCIGIDAVKGTVKALISGSVKDGKYVDYPADLGAHCEAWDSKSNPSCPGADWCEQKWCYVDPCKCKNVAVMPKPSNYLPTAKYQGHPLHFSYVTCGGKDSYSSDDAKKTVAENKATCAAKVDSAEWGNDKCRCAGVGPKKGVAKITMGGMQVDFPADAGTYCKAWEKDNDPACKGASPPAYCAEKWCYVDPCSCDVPTPPKTSSYLPDAKDQGHAVYFSYEACGGTDAWTKDAKDMCVNQKSSDDCGKLDKCGWTGTECLGKELVTVCKKGEQEAAKEEKVAAPKKEESSSDEEESSKSGAWAPKVFVAIVVTLVASFH